MKVLFTPAARLQFLAAIAHIAKDRPRAASRYHQRVGAALKRLRRFPTSGRSIPEFPDLPHREIIVPPYRFFYRLEGGKIWIVAVWHGAQLPRRSI